MAPRKKSSSSRKTSRSASKDVESAMRRRKRGTLKSGSGKKVTSRKQAIAIGLSEARAPPASGAASSTKPSEGAMNPDQGSADQSAGAKEHSSAPPGSSASETSKPNPTLGSESSKE
jgi:hypothetical protein